MSTQQLERIAVDLASRHGIIAVLTAHVESTGNPSFSATDIAELSMRGKLVHLLDAYDSFGWPESFRVVIGDEGKETTVSCSVVSDIAVLIAYPTGHPISKSILRMIRRVIAGKRSGSAAA